jgi:hydroxymethylglutaryl-CoA synthase
MSGIRAYGAYIPLTRLPLSLIQGRPAKDGGPEKAVAHDDEDAVTMGVAAAIDCLSGFDRSEIDGVLFASTSYGLKEKQAAAIVAKALDLRRDVHTADLSASLRAGTSALESALNAVKAGAAKNVLVVASDCRMGAPRGALEGKLGDGAAAFLVGERDPIATFDGSHAVTDELQDFWRRDGERFTHAWEDRFMIEEGYTPNLIEALRGLLAKTGTKPEQYARAALFTPDERSVGGVLRKTGLKQEQLQDPLFGRLGNTGTSFAPLLLVAALESARPGDRVLAASYGDGAHAFAFSVAPAIEKLPRRRGVKGHLDRRRPLRSYDSYLKGRSLDAREWEAGADLGLSATVRFRERDADISFVGGRCKRCGQVHFPEPRVCIKCHAKDEWSPYRLSDKHGKVLSYTFDFFFPTSEPPTIMIMTEVDGCRVQVQLANCKPEEVKLDMPVEYVFRKIHEAGGKPNYFWKASPLTRAT